MRVYVADFETTPFDYEQLNNYELKARFICFINLFDKNDKKYINIENNGSILLKEHILSLTSMRNPCRLYFHNLRFDIAFLYDLLPNTKDFKYDIIKSNSRVIQFKIYKEYKRVKKNNEFRIEKKTFLDIRDSLVLFPTSVEKLGNALGLPKLEQDYFVKEITQDYINYCYRDIEIIIQSLYNLKELCWNNYQYDLNLKNIPLTLPSLAKRVFHVLIERKFGKSIINEIYNVSENQEKLFREFYYGGRVEVFDFNKLQNGNYNDFNSHYSAIMRENTFPIPPYNIHKCVNSEKCFEYWKRNDKIFACICNLNENLHIPLIASKLKDKLVFGVGNKQCLLFRKEMEYLLKLKQNVKIVAIITCSKYLDLFNDFVDITYDIKKNAIFDSEKILAKLMLNSLYGKFAEKRDKEKITILQNLDGLSEQELRQTRYTNKGFIKTTQEHHRYLKTNVVFSMMITALARLKLHQYIMKSKKPYYADSDSIVSKDIIDNSNEIGNMSVEFNFTSFQALSCKEYVYERINEKQERKITIKMKGFGSIDKTHKEYFKNFNTFISKYRDGIWQNRLIGFFEAFVKDLPFGVVLVFEKYKNTTYDKRWINSDLSTKPFHLQNDSIDLLMENNSKMIDKIIEKYSENDN